MKRCRLSLFAGCNDRLSLSTRAPRNESLAVMLAASLLMGAACYGTETMPPVAPANLNAVLQSPTQIMVFWTAATGRNRVIRYRVERCEEVHCTSFLQIGETTALTLVDTHVKPSTSYTYRVRALDASGNLSAYSRTTAVAATALTSNH